jgi:phospholipase/carboxylesterase
VNRINQSISWNKKTDSANASSDPQSGFSLNSEADKPPFGKAYSSSNSGLGNDHVATDSSTEDFCLWASPPQPRSFFLPLHYTPSYRYPVIIWFHHSGFNEHQIDQIMPHLSLRNYIGIGVRGNQAADSAGHCFDWHDSPAATDATHGAVCEAIEEATSRFSVDLQRVVLAGYQNGGTMAQRVALRSPKQFAGVISMGGLMPRGELGLFDELRQRKMPLLWQWSANNPLYNEENLRADCQLAMSISADVEIRQYANDDEMNTVTLKDANDWVMRKIIANSCITDSDQWATKAIEYSDN